MARWDLLGKAAGAPVLLLLCGVL
ncbi:hypothetical protein [Salinibacterium sp.]